MRMRNKNKNNIMLSIIVPVYNVEKYLEECVQSLLNQTYQDYEIILVDDGSTDSSGKICDMMAEHSSKIRVIHKENGGLSSARNAGLKAARGRYMGFVDSDDYILPTMYEKLIYVMRKYRAQIASCKHFDFCMNSTLKEKNADIKITQDQVKVCNKREIFKLLFTHRISESVWDKLYSADLLKDCHFAEGEINEDTSFVFHLLDKASKTVVIDQELYGYRTRQGSITKSGYSEKFRVVEPHLNEIKCSIVQRYPEMIPYLNHFYSIHYFCLLNSILHLEEPGQYLNDYRIYRKKFKQVFKYFYKWERRSIKESILGFFLISPLSLMYLKRKK